MLQYSIFSLIFQFVSSAWYTEVTMEHESKTKPFTPLQIVITTLVLVGIVALLVMNPSPAQKKQTSQKQSDTSTQLDASIATLRANDHIRGNKDTASIAIIEYSDSDCPFCAKVHTTLQTLVTESKGSVVWAYRYLPLSIHPNAYSEAIALECVGELGGTTAFDAYLDALINITLNPDPKSNEMLTTLAIGQGVDGELFKTCLANPNTKARIDADMADAQTIGARGTPYNIIVNLSTGAQVIIPGAADIRDFRNAIESIQ